MVGLVRAVVELRRIERGEAPRAGRFLAKSARTLGLTQVTWLLLLIIVPILAVLLRAK